MERDISDTATASRRGRSLSAAALAALPCLCARPARRAHPDTATVNNAVISLPWTSYEEPLAVGRRRVYRGGRFRCSGEPLLRAVKFGLIPTCSPRTGCRRPKADPRFHQQMVYAVAMKTISQLRAGARAARSCGRRHYAARRPGIAVVQRLRIYPHALCEANAYYSPRRMRCCSATSRARTGPGTTCRAGRCSPACRTTSSRTRPRTRCSTACTAGSSSRPTPTCSRFHEAFADIVALFQHFTIVRSSGAPNRGHIAADSTNGTAARRPRWPVRRAKLTSNWALAPQRHRSARSIRRREPEGPPIPALPKRVQPDVRGSILVGAVFDAFSTYSNAGPPT